MRPTLKRMTEGQVRYNGFLQSDLWSKISEEQKKADGYRCVVCGSDQMLRVHHFTYAGERSYINDKNNVVTLCEECHSLVHGHHPYCNIDRQSPTCSMPCVGNRASSKKVRALLGLVFKHTGAFFNTVEPNGSVFKGGSGALEFLASLDPYDKLSSGWFGTTNFELARKLLVVEMVDEFGFSQEDVAVFNGWLNESPNRTSKRIAAARVQSELVIGLIENLNIYAATPMMIKNEFHYFLETEGTTIQEVLNMKKKNWTSIQASGGSGSGLPAGGYVLMCTGVKDNPEKEFIELTWDVAEGEHKGHYGDEWGMRNEWAHVFKVSYKDSAEGLFRHFLDCLEASNPSFNVAQWEQTSNEMAFVGKLFGAAWGTEYYTYNGEDKKRRTFPKYFTADEIRSGNFNCPTDIDNREQCSSVKPSNAPAQPYSDEYVPF